MSQIIILELEPDDERLTNPIQDQLVLRRHRLRDPRQVSVQLLQQQQKNGKILIGK